MISLGWPRDLIEPTVAIEYILRDGQHQTLVYLARLVQQNKELSSWRDLLDVRETNGIAVYRCHICNEGITVNTKTQTPRLGKALKEHGDQHLSDLQKGLFKRA